MSQTTTGTGSSSTRSGTSRNRGDMYDLDTIKRMNASPGEGSEVANPGLTSPEPMGYTGSMNEGENKMHLTKPTDVILVGDSFREGGPFHRRTGYKVGDLVKVEPLAHDLGRLNCRIRVHDPEHNDQNYGLFEEPSDNPDWYAVNQVKYPKVGDYIRLLNPRSSKHEKGSVLVVDDMSPGITRDQLIYARFATEDSSDAVVYLVTDFEIIEGPEVPPPAEWELDLAASRPEGEEAVAEHPIVGTQQLCLKRGVLFDRYVTVDEFDEDDPSLPLLVRDEENRRRWVHWEDILYLGPEELSGDLTVHMVKMFLAENIMTQGRIHNLSRDEMETSVLRMREQVDDLVDTIEAFSREKTLEEVRGAISNIE